MSSIVGSLGSTDSIDLVQLSERNRSADALLVTLFTLLAVIFALIIAFIAVFLARRRICMTRDELIREEENQAYLELNSDEQELYFQSKEYLSSNPFLRDGLSLSQNLQILEKGIAAFEFQKDSMLTNNDLIILNKMELNFFKRFECSSETNFPIPMKNEVYYFESKIYSLPDPENTLISIGLAIKPYPWFRMPGRHPHSISYDSNGYRRYNQPFNIKDDPPFPVLEKGDIVGVGYRVRSGTVFFTRNGKKVSESKIGGHIKNFKIPNNGQIYPIIGANNLCSVHANIGQMGFVFIEGNVKKWGFAPLEGIGPTPPAYNKYNSDILLERSEIDDRELSERDNDFPPDFWEVDAAMTKGSEIGDKFGNETSDLFSNDERITLDSLAPPIRPPSYENEGDSDERENANDTTQNANHRDNDDTQENSVENQHSNEDVNVNIDQQ